MSIARYHDKDQGNRLITVIQGLPFYLSTGKNSGEKNTWFPFLGTYPLSTWLIKPPSVKSLPEKIKKLFPIEKDYLIKRLGSIRTMCVSASLGSGFWEKEPGLSIRSYLHEHYSSYFLDEKTINTIKQGIANENIEDIKDSFSLNRFLAKQEIIVPFGNLLTRLPTEKEREWLTHLPHSSPLRDALKMLILANKKEISPEQYDALMEFAKHQELLDLALKHFIFEDKKQTQILFKLLEKNSGQIDLSQLSQLDFLSALRNNLTLEQVPLHFPEGRASLRTLYSICKKDPSHSSLLTSKPIQHAIIILLENHKSCKDLSKKYIRMIVSLQQQDLLKKNIRFLIKKENRDILLTLHKHHELNKKNIFIFTKLNELSLLKENTDLFNLENKKIRAALYEAFNTSFPLRNPAELIKIIRFFNACVDLGTHLIAQLKNSWFLRALITLEETTQLTKETILCIQSLSAMKLLKPSTMRLLNHPPIFNILNHLLNTNKLNQKNLLLMKKLFQRQLLEKIPFASLEVIFSDPEITLSLINLLSKQSSSNDIVFDAIDKFLAQKYPEKISGDLKRVGIKA